ncbi:MAG TPA: flagellar type III secretion system pore protein FliP [Candidatus Paceibacterota bacterium]|nr:flagellar type III secretion system pore protein FliP [Candidatus Paceibacterota bacterium]
MNRRVSESFRQQAEDNLANDKVICLQPKLVASLLAHAQNKPKTDLKRHGVSRATRSLGQRGGNFFWMLLPIVLLMFSIASAPAQTNVTGFGPVQISVGGNNGLGNVDTAVQVLFVITMLSLAPAILLLMTCFTRIVIVLSFIRTALQLQGTPANQIIIGLSLFMTYFVMAPVWENINHDALAPYQAKQITSTEAIEKASGHIRTFMLKQARPKDVELFVSMAKLQPTKPEELPLRVVIPGFIISELRTAFQMGFLIFVPFILIDLVVATVLMSMGMMMMPPTTFSLPLKLLLFVLVDGWELVIRSLVRSFGM